MSALPVFAYNLPELLNSNTVISNSISYLSVAVQSAFAQSRSTSHSLATLSDRILRWFGGLEWDPRRINLLLSRSDPDRASSRWLQIWWISGILSTSPYLPEWLTPRVRREGVVRDGYHNLPGIQRVSIIVLWRVLCPMLQSPEYVNAQYRFVMKPTGDYTVHFADPDMWDRKLLVQGGYLHVNSSDSFAGRTFNRLSYHGARHSIH